jgi:DNA-binding response OmpR family regulator
MPIDIILLDLMFPRGITGYDIFREIRSYSEFDSIPIVAVSAADATVAIPKAQEMGFSGFIAKPIDFYRFSVQIEHILDKQEVWDTPSQI